MATIDFTIRIERSVEDVFRVLTTPELTPLWSESAIEEHVTTPGPVGIGSRRRATVRRLGGGTWENEIEVTAFEANRRIAVRSVESIVPFASAWTMAAANGGTQVDWRWEFSSVAGCARSVPSSSESSGEASVATSAASRRSWSPATLA